MDNQPSFIEEIDFKELEFREVVGKGAFGVVSRALWRGKDVAVKRIETEAEKKAFMQELKQLSRVAHPNIVQLYGACREQPVCLVMEYAEGGSLYNVLHGSGRQPNYTAAHAMSWCLQCARGVEYLHNMKPKALVHRDLKPPNLLLIQCGTILKICDFGTACDIQTHMTNNKGSAAWMAPEVFEGSNYSEKCDVFSWGIILWEVLTRRKPFDEIGGPAFRIMWAVHTGQRPPPIQNLPKPLELMMTRCWSGMPPERPSMTEVVRIMTNMYQFFQGGDEPLVITRTNSESDEEDDYSSDLPTHFSATPPTGTTSGSRVSTISDTLRYKDPRAFQPATPIVVEETPKRPRTQMSAPPSLAASRESLNDPRTSRSATPVDMSKRFSADLTKLDELDLHGHPAQPPSHKGSHMGHRRIGSDEYRRMPTNMPLSVTTPLSINIGGGAGATAGPVHSPLPVHHSNTCPTQLTHLAGTGQDPSYRPPPDGRPVSPPSRSISYQPPGREPVAVSPRSMSLSNPYLPQMIKQGHDAATANIENIKNNSEPYPFLEAQLQPIPACPTSAESVKIFEEHCQLATHFVRMQAEIKVLQQRKRDLLKEREQEQERSLKHGNQLANMEEYTKLVAENESLMVVHKELKAQRDRFRNPAGEKRIA